MLSLLKGHWLKYLFSVAIIIVTSLLVLVNPILTKTIVNEIIIGGNKKILLPILFLIVGITVGRLLLRYWAQINFEVISQKIILDMRQKGFKKIMELDFGYFETHKTGDIMTQLTADLDAVRNFIAFLLYQMVENIVIFVGTLFILLFYVDTYLTAGLFLIVPIVVLLAVNLIKEQKGKF